MIKKDIKVMFICTKKHHLSYLEGILNKEFNIIVDNKNPDYIVVGEEFIGYDNNAISRFFSFYKRAITIFITLESVLPDINFFDYIISRDNVDFDGRFIRFFYNTGINENSYKGLSDNEARKLLSEKKYFCNFIYSHKGHQARDLIFRKLSEYKFVHSLGNYMKNCDLKIESRNGNFFHTSIVAKKDFKFSISAENGVYKNGVTEKIYSSFLAHTVPIYFGDTNINEYFNKDAFVNYHAYKNIDDLVERVKEIDNNDELWCKIISQPIITKDLYNSFKSYILKSEEQVLTIFRTDKEYAFKKPDAYYVDKYANRMARMSKNMEYLFNIEKILNTIAWLIQVRKWRDRFKRKFL